MQYVATRWVLERTDDPRFPFRVTLRSDDRLVLALWVQDRWPGASGNVFCIRETGEAPPLPLEVLEDVPVASLTRNGKRMAVVLDRPMRKRCEFLFLTKRYKNREGSYEQIFWQTQQGLRARRPRVRFATWDAPQVRVAVDSQERYPWSFPGFTVERRRLPAGDYALVADDGLGAVVERKTFANLLRDLSDLRVLHQSLAELARYPLASLVVEASYADFLRPETIRPLNVAYTSKALAELSVIHPNVSVIYAGTRKTAVQWARAHFAVAAARAAEQHNGESLPASAEQAVLDFGDEPTRGGTRYYLREVILRELPQAFSIATLRERFPSQGDRQLRGVLNMMRNAGELRCDGRGRTARWLKSAAD